MHVRLGITHLAVTAYQVAIRPGRQLTSREASALWGGIALLDIALGRGDYFYTLRGSTMTQEHPITPPPELVQQWLTEGHHQDYCTATEHAIAQAARWGADQELEACCEWFLSEGWHPDHPNKLRSDRRPKPLSLKEQALQALENADGADYPVVTTILAADQHSLIRHALESLPD